MGKCCTSVLHIVWRRLKRTGYTRHGTPKQSQWCKVEFEVKVIRYKEEFDCVCGLFAHMGMLSGHALKV
jgi:hypothetical protein